MSTSSAKVKAIPSRRSDRRPDRIRQQTAFKRRSCKAASTSVTAFKQFRRLFLPCDNGKRFSFNGVFSFFYWELVWLLWRTLELFSPRGSYRVNHGVHQDFLDDHHDNIFAALTSFRDLIIKHADKYLMKVKPLEGTVDVLTPSRFRHRPRNAAVQSEA